MTARRTSHLCTRLLVFAVFISLATGAQCAEPAPSAPLKIIPIGVYELNHTIVIPRQIKIPRDRNKSEDGVPAPFLAAQASRPAGSLRGEDQFGTVLRFGPDVKGQLICTEGYGGGKISQWWNDDNKLGDKKLKAYLCGSASDFTVDGGAELHTYRFRHNADEKGPDIHGADHPSRADGLASQGSGFSAQRLRFFQIPGTAMVVRAAGGTQSGSMGIYDDATTRLSDIWVSQCLGGIDCDVGDSRLRHISIAKVAKEGLTLGGPGMYIDDCHVWGADRSAVINSSVFASHCYFEAARIGTEITPSGYDTVIDGLNIGPGTCWQRGVKIEATGCTIRNLAGAVPTASTTNADIAGVEIAPGLTNENISGSLSVGGESVGLILRGSHNKIELRGAWPKSNPTLVRVAEPVTLCTVEIYGGGDGGTVLDLSASGLDRINGQGNEFKVKWGGSGTRRVVYPSGGTTYNLAPGTQVWIDGQLQSAPAKAGPGFGGK
jgi:hypothetical protein